MNATLLSYAPGALLALTPVTTTITVTGARLGMVAVASPQSDPGLAVCWCAWVSANDTVTLKLLPLSAITPNTVSWNIRVQP
jgi:hypothetical protein